MCIVSCVEAIIKADRAIERLKSTSLYDLPTVKKVLPRIKLADGVLSYQGADIVNYQQALQYWESHYVNFMDSIQECMKKRITSRNFSLMY